MKIGKKTVQVEFSVDEFVMLTAIVDTADGQYEALDPVPCQLTEEGVAEFAEGIYELRRSFSKHFQAS